MMQFLRKHQKKMFIVIAIMTVASFAFFGNSSGLSEKEDKKIGKTVSGAPIYEGDLRALVHFLSMGGGDMMRSDLIESGAFSLLAETYFEEIQNDFQEKLQKARTSTFYTHPQAPFLSAVQVWNRFAPQLLHNLREVQAGSANAKTFTTYAKLYMDQQLFSPELLRKILFYEQKNYSWLSPDYALADRRTLALFGYQTFEEWFGPRFSDILGKFILNTAAVAEKKGYKVTQKEARADFMMRCYEAARKEESSQDATAFMRLQLQIAGVDESRAVQLWRKMMIVHRFFQDLEQGVLLDSIPYEQFAAFTDAIASVEVYRLPESLRLTNFREMLKVQYYLEAISPKSKTDLPRQFYSVEEVEKKCPELVTSRYELEVAQVTQEEVLSRLGLRQTWDFETSDAGWALITKEFPVLNKSEDRETILDNCDVELRKKVDKLVRQTIVKQHPEWVQEALQTKTAETVVAEVRSKGAATPFNDIEETTLLRQALQKASVGETLYFESPGGKTYYQIKVLQKPECKQILTLQEALQQDLLGALLDEKLESHLMEARKKESAIYKDSNGSWKSYDEVRDFVGAYVYADLLKTISETPLKHDEYAAKRFQTWMERAKISIQKEGGSSPFLTSSGNRLMDQWTLSKRTEHIKRSDTTELAKAEMFTQNIGSWSSVATPLGGNVSFFYLLARDVSELKVHDQVSAGQKLIGRDAARQRMQKLLDEVGTL